MKEEVKWLELAAGEDDMSNDLPVSWTAYHQSKARDQTAKTPTINVPLPVIDYKSSTIELQYHLMKVAVEYTQYLNPGQIPVG